MRVERREQRGLRGQPRFAAELAALHQLHHDRPHGRRIAPDLHVDLRQWGRERVDEQHVSAAHQAVERDGLDDRRIFAEQQHEFVGLRAAQHMEQ